MADLLANPVLPEGELILQLQNSNAQKGGMVGTNKDILNNCFVMKAKHLNYGFYTTVCFVSKVKSVCMQSKFHLYII